MKTAISIYFIIVSFFGFAQCPSENSLIFSNQNQVDQFLVNYPNCTEILGFIHVTNPGGSGPDITNLLGLQNIEVVHDYVLIESYNLLSLEGLNNLTNIGGGLRISNTAISSINNIFNNLVTIGGYLSVGGNRYLEQIDDFHELNSIGEDLAFSSSNFIPPYPQLLSINGFEELEHINGNLLFLAEYLENISGFQSLQNVGGDLYIDLAGSSNILIAPFYSLETIGGNFQVHFVPITDFEWISNLNSIGGNLWINGGENITSFSGLSNLNSINGYLAMNDLGSNLMSLDGLDNINPSNIISLGIIESHNLSDCSKPNICQYLTNGGEYIIENNAPGCNSAEEILMNCEMNTSDEDLKARVAVFPNPAKDKLSIISDDLTIRKIELYSMNGNLLQIFKNDKKTLDVSQYPFGNYVLVISTDKGKISKKILITH